MNKQAKLIGLLQDNGVAFTKEELIAIDRCFGKRGKYKGWLTRQAPNGNKYPLANLIYNTITPNPFKSQTFNLMWLGRKYPETYKKLNGFKYPTWLDLDKQQLSDMGAW